MDSSDPGDRNPLLGRFDTDPLRSSQKLLEIFALLVKFFRWRRCQDPEDLAQEAITRGLSRLAQGVTVPDPTPYFYGIARFILREQRKIAKRDALLDFREVMASLLPIDYSATDTAILLDQDLAQIPEEEADLLVRYHTQDREQLAAELGIDLRALRTRACRAREKLRTWVRSHGAVTG